MKSIITAAFILFASMVTAQEVQVGTGLICDTQKQVERFAELYPTKKIQAIGTINDEEKTAACAIAGIAFIRGEVVSRVNIEGDEFVVVAIVVIAVKLENGWLQGQPLPQFILLKDTDKNI